MDKNKLLHLMDKATRQADEKKITLEFAVDDGLQYVSIIDDINLQELVDEILTCTISLFSCDMLIFEASGRFTREGFEFYAGARVRDNVSFFDYLEGYSKLEGMVESAGGHINYRRNRIFMIIPLKLSENYDPDDNLGHFLPEEENVAVSKVKLPQLDEFDLQTALSYLGENNLVMETLLEFYYSIDKEISLYQRWLEDIDNPDTLAQFRIRVHALKSTSKMLGANMLSGLARKGELTAISQDAPGARAVIPIIIDELIHHKKIISAVVPDESSKCAYNESEFWQIIDEIVQGADAMDLDVLDANKGKLVAMSIPGELEVAVEKIVSAIEDIDFNKVLQLAKEMRG